MSHLNIGLEAVVVALGSFILIYIELVILQLLGRHFGDFNVE